MQTSLPRQYGQYWIPEQGLPHLPPSPGEATVTSAAPAACAVRSSAMSVRAVETSVTQCSERKHDQYFQKAVTRQPQLAFVYAPTEHWEAHAKPFLLGQFTIVTLHGARVYGSLDFLPQLLERAGTESTLYKVCDAIASAYFANRSRSDSIEFGHRKLYVRALQSLSNDVSDVEKQSQDTTLAAVWLLCLYELIVGARGQEPRGWRTHGEALIGLLRLRGQNQFQTRTGCQLFQLAYQTVAE
ncbi:unnamed protein product [Aspergillus oryzae RIB40]|uniref:DNA, SC102 n=1 Tax=Aspergillus oryzae (strain ATCC 42149 / RIB 40) TaxID=510516 RepID=Q2UAB7_ASPOR|nr:unnamed protein product [Aspergillus oryzae RIB40]BAE61498.1 unnamed protein product [Aspergillus oryzae RIB40]